VTSGLDCIHVSIDGATPATYERIRLRSRLERVLHNIELLLDARARLGSERPHLRMVVVAMRPNLHELPQLVRLAHRHHMESVFVQHLCHDFGESSQPAHYRPMRDFVDAETLLREDPQRIECYFGEARGVAKEVGMALRLPRTRPRPHPAGTPGPERCDWPWHGPYISYQGLVMPCCMIATPDRLNFGSIAEQGVDAVWNGKAYQTFRLRLASDQPPEICTSCSVYTRTF
jgi:radical SAM protein with 4Fe4S-binding SPASM domain